MTDPGPFKHASARQMKGVIELGGQARDYLKDHESKAQANLDAHRERVAKAEAACAATPKHDRRMDAKHKVAADIASRTGDRAAAERLVSESMERGDRRREERA